MTMTGSFIDNIRFSLRNASSGTMSGTKIIETDFGKIRILDTQGSKPVIVNVPDGPNVIEHHYELIKLLSRNFRVICFEFPGIGFSYPQY